MQIRPGTLPQTLAAIASLGAIAYFGKKVCRTVAVERQVHETIRPLLGNHASLKSKLEADRKIDQENDQKYEQSMQPLRDKIERARLKALEESKK